jgi:glycosyltransferase involved in cell wall biosynthesis
MKIAFDAKRAFYNNTGLGNYSRNTIRQLSTFFPSNEYLLYTPSIAKKIKFDIAENCKIITPQSFTGQLFKSYWRSYLMNYQIASEKADIYHGLSNELPFGIKSVNIKKVVTIHDLIFKRFPEMYKPADRKIYDRKFKYAAEVADIVIAVSKQTANDIEEFYKIDSDKIKVVYQGCNPLFYKLLDDKEKTTVKNKYKLPSEYLLYIGTIEARKNLLGIVEALHKNKIDIPLIVIGRKTAYFDKVNNYIISNNLENKIIFIDNLSNTDLPAFYQCAKTFIYPSFFEGFGIPVLESLASGTPVITSEGSCLEEAGGEHSVYVNPYKIDSIAEGINKVLSNKDLRVNMIVEGRKHALKFTEEQVAKNLMTTYEQLF